MKTEEPAADSSFGSLSGFNPELHKGKEGGVRARYNFA